MYIMILSIMYYFTNFGDLCDSDSFHLYGFHGSTTNYDKKFILLLLTSFISEIKLFLFFNLLLINHATMNCAGKTEPSSLLSCQ